MSSMRSASSSTTQRVWSSRIERSSIRSVSRPGRGDDDVDAARHGADLGAARHAAEDEERGEPGAAGEAAEGGLDLHGELAGRGEDQRAAGLGRRAALQREELVQDRQREGGGLAGAGLGDAEDVAARHLRGDGLGLDRGRGVEAGAGERVGERLGEAERRESEWSSQVFLSARPVPLRLPPSSGACDENRLLCRDAGSRGPTAPSPRLRRRSRGSARACSARARGSKSALRQKRKRAPPKIAWPSS